MMTKRLLGFGVLLIASTLSVARADMRMGGRAGVAASSFSVSPPSSSLSGKSLGTIGGMLETDGLLPVPLELGLDYVPKGFKVPGYHQSGYYLSVPMLAKHRIPAALATVFVGAGPELSYELATYYSITAGALPTKKFDFALRGAAGVEYPLLPKIAGVFRIDYSFGLLNIVDTGLSPGQSARTRTLMMTLGWQLAL